VRLTHGPTGIVVQCQNDRSQHRNKAEAMEMLKAKLYELELRKRMSEQQKLEDSKTDVGWGHQIRSYVLDQSHQGLAYQLRDGQHQGRAGRRPGRLHLGLAETGRVMTHRSASSSTWTAPSSTTWPSTRSRGWRSFQRRGHVLDADAFFRNTAGARATKS
jgi:hypothetical protein